MSESTQVKMNTFDTSNQSPVASKESYSGYYRGFQMSYECMIEVRKMEGQLKVADQNNEMFEKTLEEYEHTVYDGHDYSAKDISHYAKTTLRKYRESK